MPRSRKSPPELDKEIAQILEKPPGDGCAAIFRIVSDKSSGSQRHIIAEIQFPDEPPMRSEFIGPTGGRSSGPVLMILSEHPTPVYDPSRFGPFGTEWVRRFYKMPPEPG